MLPGQVQTKAIGEVTYHVLPLPAGTALRVMARVLKMAAPSFADVASMREAAGAVGRVLSGLATDIDDEAVIFAARAFARETQFEVGAVKLPLVSDKADHFDEHFRGRIFELLEWLKFAAEVSYGPLVTRLMAAAPKAETPAAG